MFILFVNDTPNPINVELKVECKKAMACTDVVVAFDGPVNIINMDRLVCDIAPCNVVIDDGMYRTKGNPFTINNNIKTDENNDKMNGDTTEIVIISLIFVVLLIFIGVFIGIKYVKYSKKNRNKIESKMVNVVNSNIISVDGDTKDTQLDNETNKNVISL